MSEKTLREEAGEWGRENLANEDITNLVTDFFISKMRERVEGFIIQNKEAPPADREEEIDERAYEAALRDLLTYLD